MLNRTKMKQREYEKYAKCNLINLLIQKSLKSHSGIFRYSLELPSFTIIVLNCH